MTTAVAVSASQRFYPVGGAPRRVGYLVGRFPNAAHAYFWREVTELRRGGVPVEFCSTVHPGEQLAPHAWAKRAAEETTYLVPIPLRDWGGVMGILLRAGPGGWWRSMRAIVGAKGAGLKERVKMMRFVVLGARLLQIARRRGWEHVHSGFCNDTANIPLQAKLLGGLSYSVSLHGPLETFGGNQEGKWGHARFGTVLFERAREDLKGALGKNVPAVIGVAPMGIEVGRFTRSGPYEPWRGEGEARLLCCARVEPGKGTVDLLKALARVRGMGIDAHLTIAGEAFPRVEWFLELIEKTLDELKLRPFVTRVRLSEEGVREALEGAHVFVLASYHEGVPVAAMEAMAMELPVVATRVGGVPDCVREGVNGVLVGAGEVEKLAEALAGVLRDPERAMGFSGRNRERIVEGFQVSRNATEMARCLGWEKEE